MSPDPDDRDQYLWNGEPMSGLCGHCGIHVDSTDPNHRVTSQGDYAMTAVTFLPIVALLALTYALTFLAASRSLQRRRERAWRRWEMSVEEETRLREGLRGL